MKIEILLDSDRGVIGVAILAAIQTAIIHADIDAGHTTAFFSLILILEQRQGLTDDSFQQFTVDTMAMHDAEPRQVNSLSAGFQFQIVLVRNIRKAASKFIDFRFSKGSKLFAQMTVQIHKADDAFPGMAGETLRQFLEVTDVILCGIFGCQDDGIVSPNDSLRTNLPGKLMKSGDDHIILAGDTYFQIFAVGIQRELKIKWMVFQQVQFVQHGGGIFCPEHDAVHYILGKRNAADLFGVHWIAGTDKSRFQTVKEPVGVVGWNVCPSAGTDDHGITSD